jgi:hypothetical protein
MGDTYIINGLRRKRAYLSGEIVAAQRTLVRKRAELRNIDRMLKQLDSAIDLSAIKGIRPHLYMEAFRQGEQTRLCFAVLRMAGEPLTAREIARRMAKRKDAKLSARLVDRVRATLGRLTREGRLQKTGIRRSLRWGLPE